VWVLDAFLELFSFFGKSCILEKMSVLFQGSFAKDLLTRKIFFGEIPHNDIDMKGLTFDADRFSS